MFDPLPSCLQISNSGAWTSSPSFPSVCFGSSPSLLHLSSSSSSTPSVPTRCFWNHRFRNVLENPLPGSHSQGLNGPAAPTCALHNFSHTLLFIGEPVIVPLGHLENAPTQGLHETFLRLIRLFQTHPLPSRIWSPSSHSLVFPRRFDLLSNLTGLPLFFSFAEYRSRLFSMFSAASLNFSCFPCS